MLQNLSSRASRTLGLLHCEVSETAGAALPARSAHPAIPAPPMIRAMSALCAVPALTASHTFSATSSHDELVNPRGSETRELQ